MVGKSIVLFADGTGNSFTTQESSVWRLYAALDQRTPNQIAHYIPGVGTSGFRPWAMLDGATGFGVPSNVRKLYEFLCWNYEDGDRIYVFGFSRGAFTIRALIGMIATEGLLSTKDAQGEFLPRRTMRGNVMGAWRANRNSKPKSWRDEAPTIKVTRFMRDVCLRMGRVASRSESYDSIKKRARKPVPIHFVGLFDTVEAYGVPVEEMRDAIDWGIWPIKFYDQKLSPIVTTARHALSLDDERQTFHPLRFDMTDEKPWDAGRIKEVWFAGVHSDVGGGYPDAALSYIPLKWMVDELGRQLKFLPGELDSVRNDASPMAPMHDSRSGAAVLYRYSPRIIGERKADGGPPVIHHSVAEKIVFGGERYAPKGLPASAYVLMPDGSRKKIRGFQTAAAQVAHEATAAQNPQQLAEAAVAHLSAANQAFIDTMRDGIWLRRAAYFLLLFSVLCVAVLPWLAGALAGLWGAATGARVVKGVGQEGLARLIHDGRGLRLASVA